MRRSNEKKEELRAAMWVQGLFLRTYLAVGLFALLSKVVSYEQCIYKHPLLVSF